MINNRYQHMDVRVTEMKAARRTAGLEELLEIEKRTMGET